MMNIVDQEQELDEAITKCQTASFNMKKAIETNNLKEALKNSSIMLAELKATKLSPKNYYSLFSQAFDEIKYLEQYFSEEQKKGRKMADVYEAVQYAQSLIPRIYLMITVASIYISGKEIKASSILSDLVDMMKSVQNPMRGLFVRYFMLKMLKEKLPDKSESEISNDPLISINFILQNLNEMNKLWSRMQYGASKEKTKRESDRNELRVTVGENIVRLAALSQVNSERYKNIVLPKLLEIICSTKDSLSQQYLMDCIIQVFPDEFHLMTLEKLIDAIQIIQTTIDVKPIYISLMDRLSNFASEGKIPINEIEKQVNIFNLFSSAFDKSIAETGATDIKRLLDLQFSFLKFCMKCYPDNLTYINKVLESTVKLVQIQPVKNIDGDSLKIIVKILTITLESSPIKVLEMSQFIGLMQFLQLQSRRVVAKKIVNSLINSRIKIDSQQLLNKITEFLKPLIESPPEGEQEEAAFEFEETQTSVSKIIHLIDSSNIQNLFDMISFLKELFMKAGNKRLKYYTPPMVFSLLKICKLADSQEIGKNLIPTIFKTAYEVVNTIAKIYPEIAIRLFLSMMLTLNLLPNNSKQIEELAYQCGSECLTIYQNEISDSEMKIQAITLIISTLSNLKAFSEENFTTLAENAAQYCSKLLKKQDQCKAILQCSHMFDSRSNENSATIECLKKSYALAQNCRTLSKSLEMYIFVIQKYIYFNSKPSKIISDKELKEVIDELKTELAIRKDKEEVEEITKQLRIIELSLEVKRKSSIS